MLYIDSGNQTFVNAVKAALNQICGNVRDALAYTEHGGWVRRRWIEVTAGAGIREARAARPCGARLVQRVITTNHWCRIVESQQNSTSAEWEWGWDVLRSNATIGGRTQTEGAGTASIVRWSGQADVTVNMTPRGVVATEGCPAYVLLAHELIHADHLGRGVFAPHRVNVTFTLDTRKTDLGLPRYDHSRMGFQLTSSGDWTSSSMELAEEVHTVGMNHDDPRLLGVTVGNITENDIRRENHLNQRVKYGALNRTLDASPDYRL